jgi:hypothetical protein
MMRQAFAVADHPSWVIPMTYAALRSSCKVRPCCLARGEVTPRTRGVSDEGVGDRANLRGDACFPALRSLGGSPWRLACSDLGIAQLSTSGRMMQRRPMWPVDVSTLSAWRAAGR